MQRATSTPTFTPKPNARCPASLTLAPRTPLSRPGLSTEPIGLVVLIHVLLRMHRCASTAVFPQDRRGVCVCTVVLLASPSCSLGCFLAPSLLWWSFWLSRPAKTRNRNKQQSNKTTKPPHCLTLLLALCGCRWVLASLSTPCARFDLCPPCPVT